MNAARRMVFQFEGTLRWNRVVVDAEARGKGHNGREGPGYGDGGKHRGRDTAYWSLCWDDWAGGEERGCAAADGERGNQLDPGYSLCLEQEEPWLCLDMVSSWGALRQGIKCMHGTRHIYGAHRFHIQSVFLIH